jgi:hypothetical protein
LVFLLPLLTVSAKEWDEALYKQIEQSIKAPQISGKDYDITKYGAKPSNSAAQNQRLSRKPSTSARRKAADVWWCLPD